MELTVNVIKAILTHNTQIGSEMDPFVVLKLGTYEKRSETLQQAGDMPTFDYSASFSVQPTQQNLHLIVYDQDATIDDLVGQIVIDLKPILVQPFTEKKWYSLKYDGRRPAGKILVEFTCRRNGNLQCPTKQEVKEIMRPKLHPIGMAPQHIRSGKLYGMETDETSKALTEYERRLTQSHSQRSGSKLGVFSFRNATVRNGNNNLNSPGYQNNLPTRHTSRVMQNSAILSSSSSRSFIPQYRANHGGYYGFNGNQHNNNYPSQNNQHKNIYATYQQPPYPNNISNSVVYPPSNGWCNGMRIGSSSCLRNC